MLNIPLLANVLSVFYIIYFLCVRVMWLQLLLTEFLKLLEQNPF